MISEIALTSSAFFGSSARVNASSNACDHTMRSTARRFRRRLRTSSLTVFSRTLGNSLVKA